MVNWDAKKTGSGEYILVVDDQKAVGRVVAQTLEFNGFVPLTALNMDEAMAHLPRDPKAAIVDLQLAGESGLDVCRALIQRLPRIKCIMLTGYATTEAAIAAVNSGAYAFLRKPFDPDELVVTVRRALDALRAEEAVLTARRNFHDIVDKSREGLLLIGHDGLVRFANPAARAFLRAHGLAEGKPLAGRIQEQPQIDIVRDDGDPGVGEVRISPTEWQGEEVLLVSVHDVTDRVQLEKEIASISLREREAVRRDLHDSVCQKLTAAGLMAKNARLALITAGSGANNDLQLISDLVKDALRETRAIAAGLQPVSEEPGSFRAAIEELVARSSALGPTACTLEWGEGVDIGDQDTASQVYLVVQEAVNNAVKYAEARTIAVRLRCVNTYLEISVTDDGRGFVKGTKAIESGLGMNIMRFRAEAVGATLDVQSRPGQGTSIRCVVQAKPPVTARQDAQPELGLGSDWHSGTEA